MSFVNSAEVWSPAPERVSKCLQNGERIGRKGRQGSIAQNSQKADSRKYRIITVLIIAPDTYWGLYESFTNELI